VADHAREVFSFNLTLLLGATVLTLGLGAVLTLPVGIVRRVLVGSAALVWRVCGLMATVKALDGQRWRDLFSLRLLR
jgi:uncharacterized Tic20 family protein